MSNTLRNVESPQTSRGNRKIKRHKRSKSSTDLIRKAFGKTRRKNKQSKSIAKSQKKKKKNLKKNRRNTLVLTSSNPNHKSRSTNKKKKKKKKKKNKNKRPTTPREKPSFKKRIPRVFSLNSLRNHDHKQRFKKNYSSSSETDSELDEEIVKQRRTNVSKKYLELKNEQRQLKKKSQRQSNSSKTLELLLAKGNKRFKEQTLYSNQLRDDVVDQERIVSNLKKQIDLLRGTGDTSNGSLEEKRMLYEKKQKKITKLQKSLYEKHKLSKLNRMSKNSKQKKGSELLNIQNRLKEKTSQANEKRILLKDLKKQFFQKQLSIEQIKNENSKKKDYYKITKSKQKIQRLKLDLQVQIEKCQIAKKEKEEMRARVDKKSNDKVEEETNKFKGDLNKTSEINNQLRLIKKNLLQTLQRFKEESKTENENETENKNKNENQIEIINENGFENKKGRQSKTNNYSKSMSKSKSLMKEANNQQMITEDLSPVQDKHINSNQATSVLISIKSSFSQNEINFDSSNQTNTETETDTGTELIDKKNKQKLKGLKFSNKNAKNENENENKNKNENQIEIEKENEKENEKEKQKEKENKNEKDKENEKQKDIGNLSEGEKENEKEKENQIENENENKNKNENEIEIEIEKENQIEKENENKNEMKTKAKNQISDLDTINTLFSIPMAIEYFKEFMFEQLNQENLLFYIDVMNFTKACSVDQKQLQKIGKNICDKYIKINSLFEINIDSKCRSRILQNVKNKNYSLDMFDQAKQTVFNHMNLDSFDEFKKNDLYKKFLKASETSESFKYKPVQKAVLISKGKKQKALNEISRFKGRSRAGNVVANELIATLIELFGSHFSISTNEIDFILIQQSIAFSRFVNLTTELQKVKFKKMSQLEKTCFFLNIHNCLFLHSAIINGIPTEESNWKQFQKKSRYLIGGNNYSLEDISQGILRGNLVYKNKKEFPYFQENDPRARLAVNLDTRVLFTLFHYEFQEIFLTPFTSDDLIQDLNQISSAILRKHSQIIENKKIILPKIFKSFILSFAENRSAFVKWIIKSILIDNNKNIDFTFDDIDEYSLKFTMEISELQLTFDSRFSHWKYNRHHKRGELKFKKIDSDSIKLDSENNNTESATCVSLGNKGLQDVDSESLNENNKSEKDSKIDSKKVINNKSEEKKIENNDIDSDKDKTISINDDADEDEEVGDCDENGNENENVNEKENEDDNK
ncbi:electron carrier/ protein disulfide oxidoreductase [Anaeramoeba flamelloides]|uniref:Electron carrier/ protein disulfide oxidoreductase n=1 Tax=Anaeramoeba flamelloides TaxID=1746091 RepID=A0AAV7Y5Y2_9EUKA|nr:electron carrier/ protein disulfide oxidoreductase [Anaeramoeba flamelloides]